MLISKYPSVTQFESFIALNNINRNANRNQSKYRSKNNTKFAIYPLNHITKMTLTAKMISLRKNSCLA